MAMFSSVTAEPMRPYPHHDRHASDQLHSYAVPPRPVVELPRPLEPRPTHNLQPSLLDSSSSTRRQESFRGHAPPAQSEYRPQTQSLPRIHDILTSAPPEPPSQTYSSGWNPTNGPANQQNGDGYHSHPGWHPSYEHSHGYQAPPPSRLLELPILETSPVTRHDSHVAPSSPYAPYPDPSRDYHAARNQRPRQPSMSSYPPNGVPSPYASAGPDDGQHYRSPIATLERPPSSAFGGQSSAEASKKYMGVRDVPGEGTFHMYEGGFRIPTHVDGEQVNPAWGLTKANKPRKRLAMACLDCREKKIKCEPGAQSCLQCEKAKRPCRKAPTHQSQAEPNASTPAWQSSTAGSPGRKAPSESSPTDSTNVDSDTATKRRQLEDPSPGGPTKKHRSTSPSMVINGNGAPVANGTGHHVSPVLPRSPGKLVTLDEDPFSMEPQMTVHLVDHYFAAINNATYSIFPRHHFMHWLTAYPRKCQNELMVLYAMIALGSIFAEDAYAGFGRHCAGIATDAAAAKNGRLNLALAQTRLLLGLYHFARGSYGSAWDYTVSGVNAATYLRYHTEQGCADERDVQKEQNEFGLSKEQLAECKRRTLWSGFLMDRYCGAAHTVINPQDIFLRLPCTEEAYERRLASKAPFFNNGIVDPEKAILTVSSEISPMSSLVLVSAIWGDVVNFIHRSVYRAPSSYGEEYDRFFEKTRASLQDWLARLPDYLQFSQANLERSIREGYTGPFVSMHVLFHLSFIKMSRFVRHEYISKSLSRNVLASHHHAHEVLNMMRGLAAAKEVLHKEGQHASLTLTAPFTGYAVLAAVDVVGAGGLDSSLKATLDSINWGLQALRELGGYWESARDQHKACEKRYYQIQNVLKHPFTAHSGCWLGREWGVDSSLEREFGPEDDCIYGISDRDYFDALKDDGRGPNGRTV